MKPQLVLDYLQLTANGNAEYMVRRVDRKATIENVAVIRRSFPDDPIIRFCPNVDLTEFDLTKIRIMMNRIKRNVA